jgi:hypothetical protein
MNIVTDATKHSSSHRNSLMPLNSPHLVGSFTDKAYWNFRMVRRLNGF